MPKCASTSIQHFLDSNAALLQEHGVFYDRPEKLHRTSVANAFELRRVMSSMDQTRLDTYLDRFLKHDGTVILSSEWLLDMARFEHPKQFIEAVAARGFHLKIVCVVRRQDSWIEADFNQHIKTAAPWSDPLPMLIAERKKQRILNYHAVLSDWTRYVPKDDIVLIPMRSGQSSNKVLEDFMEVLGHSVLFERCALPDVEKRNLSKPVGIIEPARLIKLGYQQRLKLLEKVSPVVSRAIVSWLVGRFMKRAEKHDIPKRRFLMTLAERKALVADFAAQNARLAEDFYDGEPVFDDIFVADPASEQDLDKEAAAFLSQYHTDKK